MPRVAAVGGTRPAHAHASTSAQAAQMASRTQRSSGARRTFAAVALLALGKAASAVRRAARRPQRARTRAWHACRRPRAAAFALRPPAARSRPGSSGALKREVSALPRLRTPRCLWKPPGAATCAAVTAIWCVRASPCAARAASHDAAPSCVLRPPQSLSAAANAAATAALLRLKAPQAVDAEAAAQVRVRAPPPRLQRWLRRSAAL